MTKKETAEMLSALDDLKTAREAIARAKAKVAKFEDDPSFAADLTKIEESIEAFEFDYTYGS